jgi:hypothetical protein
MPMYYVVQRISEVRVHLSMSPVSASKHHTIHKYQTDYHLDNKYSFRFYLFATCCNSSNSIYGYEYILSPTNQQKLASLCF